MTTGNLDHFAQEGWDFKIKDGVQELFFDGLSIMPSNQYLGFTDDCQHNHCFRLYLQTLSGKLISVVTITEKKQQKWRASPHVPDGYLAYNRARIRKGLEELRGKKHPIQGNSLFCT